MFKSGVCVLCGNSSMVAWGGENIHTRFDIAGTTCEKTYHNGKYSVSICASCGLATKSPLPIPSELEKYYKVAKAGQWGGYQSAQDGLFLNVERLAIKSIGCSGNVLDFGCSNGEMLASWSGDWNKYGMELSADAKKSAETKGITIIGGDDDLAQYDAYYDLITMIDVIEHLPNPHETFIKLEPLLKKNGLFIIVTGNTDAFWYKYSKGSYWYCDIPEHVCFYNKKSFDYLARQYGLKIIKNISVSHTYNPRSYYQYYNQLFKNIGFLTIKGVGKAFPPLKMKRTTYPSFTASKDHSLIVLRKV